MEDFVYWRYDTPLGVRIEQVYGGRERYSSKVWHAMARQIWAESGKDIYRETGHYENGAPFLYGSEARISISHTHGMLVVGNLPRTPEAELSAFNERTAMGIDVERSDRRTPMGCCGKFLSLREQKMISEDDAAQYVVAWTIKESLYKAMFQIGVDFIKDIEILQMPRIHGVVDGAAMSFSEDMMGKGRVRIHRGEKEEWITFDIYTRRDGDYIITIAVHPKCAKFKRT